MQETIGTLALKIARLQHQLRVLQIQQQLGRGYPGVQADLIRRQLMVEHQLGQLMHSQEELQIDFQPMARQAFNEEFYGTKPVYPVN